MYDAIFKRRLRILADLFGTVNDPDSDRDDSEDAGSIPAGTTKS